MKPANKVALVLITFFVGAFGGHKHYVKKHGIGILYLLFCWTLITSLVALIEFIIYIVKSEEDLESAYPDTLSGGATAGWIIGSLVVGIIIFMGVSFGLAILLGGSMPVE